MRSLGGVRTAVKLRDYPSDTRGGSALEEVLPIAAASLLTDLATKIAVALCTGATLACTLFNLA
jgi:hypothetical protein